LVEGSSIVRSPSGCDDALAAVRLAAALGAKIARVKDEWRVDGGIEARGPSKVDCGESAFCIRAGIPIAALSGRNITFTGSRTLLARPLGDVEKPMKALGASCVTKGGFAPATVKGKLMGGKARVDASLTSQFASGLAMALPLAAEDSEIAFTAMCSRRYLEMTLESVRGFGGRVQSNLPVGFSVPGGQAYRPSRVEVEGDWSGAAFMLVAGAIAGRVSVKGLDLESMQPDIAIIEALRMAGADIKARAGSVTASRGELDGFDFDVTASPDLLPPLAALACRCSGRTTIIGVARTRSKESDRAATLASGLRGLGAKAKAVGDRLIVEGGPLKGGSADSLGDHRIAMALAVAALRSERGGRIMRHECVAKSYPSFFEDLGEVMAG
jgi:3-phosphoshikimate 1-carboxyvinyltransferase